MRRRMARKAELNNGLNNVQRVNKQNQFVPSAVLTRTGIIPVNTARTSGTKIFSTARQSDYPHRALKNKGIVDSGCSRHMTGNKAYLDEFQDFNGGPVAFGGSRGYITGKGKIKTGELDFEDVCFVKELQHFNLFSVSQICDKKNKVLFTDSEWDSDKEDESAQDCFVLPIWPSYSSTITPALTTDDKREGPREEEKGAAKPSSTNIFSTVSTPAKASSTNLVNTVSIPVSTLSNPNEGLSLSDPTNPEEDDSEIPPLEDIYQNPPIPPTSLADFTNLETVVNVSPIPTSRIHSTHPKALILGDPNSAVQTRSKVNKSSGAHAFVSYVQKQKRTNHKDFHHCLFACFLSQHEPKKISEALEDESWVDAMQEELLQFEIQKVWVLVDLPYGKKAIGTKWVYRNKKDERGVVVRNKASLSNGMAKSALHYGKIDEEYIVSTTLRIVPMLEQTLTGKSTTGGFQFLAETHSWSMQKANIQCGYFYLQRQKYVATEGKSVDTKSMHERVLSLEKTNLKALPTPSPAPTGEVPHEPQTDSSPAQTSEVPFEQQTDQSPRPSPTTSIPDSIPETSGGNLGGHSSSDKSLSGNEGDMTLQSVYDICLSLCAQQRFPRKSFSKKHRVHKESVSKQGRKFGKGKSSVQRDPLFDEVPEDTGDHMDTENAQDEGRTREIVDEDKEIDENILSTEDVLSTDKKGVSTDMEKVSTNRPIVSTDGSKVSTKRPNEGTEEPNEGTEEQNEGDEEKNEGTKENLESTKRPNKGTEEHIEGTKEQVESTDGHKKGTEEEIATQDTQTTTSTIFGDDETIAKVLLNMSQAKAVSREKEKGVELRDIEEADRPKPTSTRSLLTLKPLPKIDPKDKGKKKIEEEDESESESDGIPEAEKKFKQLETDEEMARKIQEEWEEEEERNRIAEEQAAN
ncbi:hypothetical protein Tco_0590208 [Tanacetum coccineum]